MILLKPLQKKIRTIINLKTFFKCSYSLWTITTLRCYCHSVLRKGNYKYKQPNVQTLRTNWKLFENDIWELKYVCDVVAASRRASDSSRRRDPSFSSSSHPSSPGCTTHTAVWTRRSAPVHTSYIHCLSALPVPVRITVTNSMNWLSLMWSNMAGDAP